MGLLVDPGAHGNLVGENWAKQQRALGHSFGYIADQNSPQDPLEVNGVGKGPDYCREQWRLPKGTQEISQEEEGVGSIDSYTAPVIPGSDVPALLGNASLRKLDAIVECGPGRLHLCGPGSRELVLPVGTRSYNLTLSRSGHWLLPCSRFKEAAQPEGTGRAVDRLQSRAEALDFATSGDASTERAGSFSKRACLTRWVPADDASTERASGSQRQEVVEDRRTVHFQDCPTEEASATAAPSSPSAA